MKKKIIYLLAVLLFCVALASGGCRGGGSSNAPKQGTVKLSISFLDPDEGSAVAAGWHLLKDTLEEKSNGAFQVTLYPNKQIANSDLENAEKVQQNIIQMSSVPTSALVGLADIKGYNLFDYPYLFSNDEELNKVLDSEISSRLSKELSDKTGVKSLGGFSIGWLKVSTVKNKIEKPSDFKGEKIRTMSADMLMATIAAWGASPTPMAFGEVFTALQQGAIDGVMTTDPIHATERYFEIEKYIICTDSAPLVHIPIVNNIWYESLSADMRQIFDESVPVYLAGEREFQVTAQANALKTLEGNGMTVVQLNDMQKKPFIDATASLITEKANIAGKEIVNRTLEILGKN